MNGLVFAGLVFLLAAGLSVIFGVMDVLNLA
ncbi:MAG: branched-chain amino acid ABC transporter permease, partial [Chloroflexi bacterium]